MMILDNFRKSPAFQQQKLKLKQTPHSNTMQLQLQKNTNNFNSNENTAHNELFHDLIKLEEPSQSNEQKPEKKVKRTCKGIKKVKRWGDRQRCRYLMFIQKYQENLESESFKKFQIKTSWYEFMSTFVKDTNTKCCRGYHNFKIKKHKSIEGIIDYYADNFYFGQQDLETQLKDFKKTLRKNKENIKKILMENNTHRQGRQNFQVVYCESLQQKKEYNLQFEDELKKNSTCSIIEDEKLCQIEIPIETLLIFQREQPENYRHSNKDLKKISQIIDDFKKGEQKDYEEERTPLLSMELKTQKLEKKTNLLDGKQKQVSKQTIVKKQKITKQMTEKKYISWTKQEAIKMIVFLNIEKEKFLSNDKKKKHGIYERCSKYVDTDKTPRICQKRINSLTNKYKKDINKMIEQESKRYQITQDIIEEAKNLYNNSSFSFLNCEINVEAVFVPKEIFIDTSKFQLNEVISKTIQEQTQIDVYIQFQEEADNKKIITEQKEKFKANTLQNIKDIKIDNEKPYDSCPPEQTFIIKVLASNNVFQQLFNSLKIHNYKSSKNPSIVHKSRDFIITKKNAYKKLLFKKI